MKRPDGVVSTDVKGAASQFFAMQLLCENQKPCYAFCSRRIKPALLDARRGKGEDFFYIFSPQPIEKSRFGRIKPSKPKQFYLDLLGCPWSAWGIWPPSANV
jgi:hypothetical protein